MGTDRGSLHRVRRGVGRITAVSVPGVLASHGRVPAYARSATRTSGRRPSARALGVLVALALGAMAVVAVVVPRVPALAQAVGLAPAAPAPVAAPPVTVTATVTATASCVSADPHDQVVLDVAGARRPAALDGCGRAPGTPVAVVVPADGRIAGPVAVAGSGAQTPTATTDIAGDGVSPLVARLELALAVAAALGAGALFVVVARGSTGRAGTPHRTRRPAARTPLRPGQVPAQRGRDVSRATRRTGGPHGVRPEGSAAERQRPTRARPARSTRPGHGRRAAAPRRRR